MAHPITYYREKFRPQYHFSPERNFINDPCGLVHFDGEYHLFYQYNPFDLDQDPNLLYWGHAISDDLLHWRHMPLQLGPDENGGISTGCGVVDWHETSGLFGDGALVISTLVFPTPFGGDIRVFARGGAVTLERLRVHRLGSVWNDS